MTEGAEAAIHLDDGSGADRADEPQDLLGDLRGKATNLGVMVTTYEGSPESIDGSNLAGTKKMIGDINKHIRDLIDSGDFEGDEHEYAKFYRAAMKALDKYGYVRAAYDKVDPSARAAKLGPNDFAQAVQNAELFIKQRWECIKALRYLHDKLSSELD
jgi:glutamine synthetase type III